MEFRVLALGDVTSEDGTRHLARTLRPFQKSRISHINMPKS